MNSKNGVAVLRTRIEKELRQIKKVVERVEKGVSELSQEPPDMIVVGLAGYIHSFYNGLEKIFDLIAEYVDNFVPPDKAWHKELLKQMTLEIHGVRPAVLTAELASVLEDYLEFRHFFRHSYSFDLDWDELKPKAENLKPTFEKLEAAFQRFFVFLQSASEQIE
jgi:hypothetical protein